MAISLKKKDVIWGYVGTAMSMFSNLLILPLVVFFLDGEMLGLWYVFSSIGSLTALFDFGFGVTFSRNVAYCWSGAVSLKREGVILTERAEPNFYLLKRILTTCRLVYLVISVVALVLLGTVGTLYIMTISSSIEGYAHLVGWAAYVLAIFLNLYFGYFSTFLRGVGAVASANKNTVYARLVQLAATAVLLCAGCGIVGACIAYLLYGTLLRLLGRRSFFSYQGIGEKLKQIKGAPEKGEIKNLFSIVWHNAWRDGVVSLSNYLSGQASVVVSSFYLGLTVTGMYSLGVQVATAVMTIAGALYTTYQPVLQSAYANDESDTMKRTMSFVVLSFIALMVLGTIAAAGIGLPLLSVIKPESIIPVGLFLILSLYQFVVGFRNCYTSYFSCTNRIIYVKSFLISSLACIVLQILFVGIFGWGVWGLVFAQIISQLAFNAWYWPLKAHKEMHLSPYEMVSIVLKKIRASFKTRQA